jgi:hypothetical protein
MEVLCSGNLANNVGNEDWPLSHKATVIFGVNFHQNVNKKVLVNGKGGKKFNFKVVSLNAPESLEFVCIYGSHLHRRSFVEG